MSTESRSQFDKPVVFRTCEEMGEAAVLADLERAGMAFQSNTQKWLAWEWIYAQRINRDIETQAALRDTARKTMWIAIATFLVALFTALLVYVETVARH